MKQFCSVLVVLKGLYSETNEIQGLMLVWFMCSWPAVCHMASSCLYLRPGVF
jgi:hypothetical protein